MSYYNSKETECQEADALLNHELETKFAPKRLDAELLSSSYSRLGYLNKAKRVNECGTLLEFRRPLTDWEPPTAAAAGVPSGDGWKLHTANFCRDRLCPMCSWRRSYKIFGQVSQIMEHIGSQYAFLFLTLTIPNCCPDELSFTLDNLQKGWHRLINSKRFKGSVRGYFKALEVTRNKLNGTYHPHYHCILAVDLDYFKKLKYISRDEWLSLWQVAMHNTTITQVDVRRCKAKETIIGQEAVKSLKSAVAEVAKYSVKSSDYLTNDNALTDDIVLTLGSALSSRRLCSFGGVFEQVRRKLALDDIEDGDLIHLDGSELRPDVAYMVKRFGWSCGAYKLLSFSI